MGSGEHEDPHQARVRDRLETMRLRSENAQSWRDQAHVYDGLVNRDGYVTIRAHLSHDDIGFLTWAREDVIVLADVALRLLELHRPRDAGGITSDPAYPIRRCRSCMWRWPCPTFRVFSEMLDRDR